MKTSLINSPAQAREIADRIVTILTSITEQESAREREKNAVDARFDTIISTLKDEAKTLQSAFQAFLKKKDNQSLLFDEGNRSGHSTLATFGYRDSAPALKALQGKVSDVAERLYKEGKTDFLTVEAPKVSINLGRLKEAQLGPGALADLGLRWDVKTSFFIEPTNATVTGASVAKA